MDNEAGETESLRDSLEASSAAMSAPTEAPAPVADATPEPAAAETSATPAPVARADGRDDKGRFAQKNASETSGQAAPPATPPASGGAASSTQAPQVAETVSTPAPKPGEPDTTHAPPSWKIGARQDWDKTPQSVRAETHRRELEMQQFVTKTAPDRQMASELRQILSPISQSIQARGTTPARLVASYVEFDRALSSGDPATAARALVGVAKGYGIPVEAVADAWDGKGIPQQRQPSVEELREQIRAEERANWQAQQQQHEARLHHQKVAEFAKKADPILFNEDVRHDMAALIEGAAARGVELSLQDAYDRAIRANPEAWAIVQQKEQAELAATKQQATQRSEAAASSVKSRPASPVGGESRGNSLRADLEAEAANMTGRM
jgi:hypothetical protein